MGKAVRNRRRRRAQQQNAVSGAERQLRAMGATPVRVGSAEGRELVTRFAGETEMSCRATFIDELFPGAGTVAPITGLDDAGQPVFDVSGTIDRLPVLMFEPAHMLLLEDLGTGTFHDHRTEALVAGGFSRVPPFAILGGRIAEGWQLFKTADGVVLLDPYGGEVAEGKLTLDPEWVSAATSNRRVMVLFGPQLGIRVPPGQDPASYTAKERLDEFHRCRHAGQVIAATVTWRGPQRDQALSWALLREGSLGLALPLVYVPAMSFKAHGGAEAFGFTAFPPPDTPINEPAVAHGLVAELTSTDLDLIRPGEDRDLGWVCGYHAAAGDRFFEPWRREAYRRGVILVVSGTKELPVTGPDCADRALKVLLDSMAAAVPLTRASLRSSSAESAPEAAAQSAAREEAAYMRALTEKLQTLESFTVDVAPTIVELIDLASFKRWVTNLWPVVCQTCGEPLGAKADISVDGAADGRMVLVSMHHSACRPSGIGRLEKVAVTGASTCVAAGWLGDLAKPSEKDIPVVVVNPSCEQLLLERCADGQWRNATLDSFAALGFTAATGGFPPLISGAQAELSGKTLAITAPCGPLGEDYRWEIEPHPHVIDVARASRGLAVSATTKVLPSRLAPDELPSAFADPEALTAWIRARDTEPPRTRQRHGRR